jgi:peptidoglycan/xylan/chitin deacetylase (PgdA/CDA1 family)
MRRAFGVFLIIISLGGFVYLGYYDRNNQPSQEPSTIATDGINPTETPISSQDNSKVNTQPIAQVALANDFCIHVPVLMYHHIEPENQAITEGHKSLSVDTKYFDTQMQYVSTHYKSINSDQLATILKNKTNEKKDIVVTFDDGYSDFFTYAYPILQKYHIIANLMIPTGLMNNFGYLNWDQLKQMVSGGSVFAYDHTWSHASLPSVTQSRMYAEIIEPKQKLDQVLGTHTDIFAYPYGDENAKDEAFLKQNGFVLAYSTKPGQMQCASKIYDLPRTRIGNAPMSAYGV